MLPNWKHLPVGYHGRSSSIVVSGTDIVRPSGQRKGPSDDVPVFGPSVRLDIGAELGFVVGVGNPMGEPIEVADAEQHIFGVVLFNDWSARDIQAWEYIPLGHNLGKSFASTVSAWVTPLLALEDARVDTPVQTPAVLPYLALEQPWGLDIDLEVEWNGEVVSRPPYSAMYWSPAQMLARAQSCARTRPSRGDRDPERPRPAAGVGPGRRGARAAAEMLGSEGHRAFVDEGDISDEGYVRGRVSRTVERYGQLDVLTTTPASLVSGQLRTQRR